jgi:hypothetical protein
MVILGFVDFFQGLIALLQDDYYVVTRSGFLLVDLTAWGWIMLIWGALVLLAGCVCWAARAGLAGSQSSSCP